MVHFVHQERRETETPQNEQEEKSMKKLLGLFLALIMLVSCTAALADDPIVLTYAEVNPLEGTIVGEVAKDC